MEEKWLVGVDLGGTTIKLAFINVYGEILHKWEIPTNTGEQGKHITLDVAKAIDKKLEELGRIEEQINWYWYGSSWSCTCGVWNDL